MMNYKLHTPDGVKDYLPEEYALKKKIENSVQGVFDKCGYKAIDTPAFEYIQVLDGMGGIEASRMYKLLDRDGSILALRSDYTPAIARIAATAYTAEDIPLRFCYVGNCYRYNENYQGKLREFTQAGVELIGKGGFEADTEILKMAVDSLIAAGLDDFRVDIGEVSFLHGILEGSGISAELTEKIRSSILEKNYVGVSELAVDMDASVEVKNILIDLPMLIGGIELLERLESVVKNSVSRAALSYMHDLYDALGDYRKYISFDFSVMGQMEYYTGLVFRGYARGTGFSIVDGGRYDNLVKNFGANYPAVGFSVNINNLMAAVK